jgi:hypothetical protein
MQLGSPKRWDGLCAGQAGGAMRSLIGDFGIQCKGCDPFGPTHGWEIMIEGEQSMGRTAFWTNSRTGSHDRIRHPGDFGLGCFPMAGWPAFSEVLSGAHSTPWGCLVSGMSNISVPVDLEGPPFLHVRLPQSCFVCLGENRVDRLSQRLAAKVAAAVWRQIMSASRALTSHGTSVAKPRRH